ncbi:AI-2E family transporter [Paenibacillus crassostreae]|uniref:Permease n=1 Tax=Paenibacillus crassostreae TaxID=1763538 RepID=A0A167CI91_9BACL|nr:AI-2E family transporter [Paenibacillus crassostreae]AOZ91849.1 AI-2E family transporter [Paenibacillus crassostreae]OAB73228.1 permease [Paenibacillus crassostreae]
MLPLYKKYWRTIFDIALIALTIFLTMFIFSKLYQLAAPVFLSFIIFLMIEPLARFLHKKGLNKTLSSAISVLLFILVILGILLGAGLIVISQISNLQDNLPYYTLMIQREFTHSMGYLHTKLDLLPPGILEKLNEYFALLTDFASNFMVNSFKYLVSIFSSFSSFLGNFGIAIILAFFLSSEIDNWRRIAREKSPKTIKNAFTFLKENVFISIGSYLKAQLIMVIISFVILYIGFLILNTGNSLTLALICALLDILPLVGVPVIFIPWIIYLFVVGKVGLAIGLSVLLIIVLVTRQLLEPKIAGNSIGVTSAFLMLSCMFISLSLFGIAGLILSPILLILIKELLQQGFLQRWIRLPQEEFEVSPFDMSQPAVADTPSTEDNTPII